MTVMDHSLPTKWPETEIEKLVKCQLRICADLAIRLAIHLKTTPEFWMNLQSTYDLRRAQIRYAGWRTGAKGNRQTRRSPTHNRHETMWR